MNDSTHRRFPRYWMLTLLLWLLAFAWMYAPPSHRTVDSIYSRGLYPHIETGLSEVTQALPFSVAIFIITTVVFGFLFHWLYRWGQARRSGLSHWHGLFLGIRHGLLLAPFMLLWFVAVWGAGYQRERIEDRLGFDTKRISPTETRFLRQQLLRTIVQNLPTREERNSREALSAIADSMQHIVGDWEGTKVYLPQGVKTTPPGILLCGGTSGICAPFTIEPHVDSGLPDTAFVYVGAHELGHVAGYCVEAEATLMGFAAGLSAQNKFARYAVALNIYHDLVYTFFGLTKDQALRELPGEAQEDLDRVQKVYTHYRINAWRDLNRIVYTHYLKSHGMKDGMLNYSRGISLFTYAWRKGLIKFTPLPVPPDRDLPNPLIAWNGP